MVQPLVEAGASSLDQRVSDGAKDAGWVLVKACHHSRTGSNSPGSMQKQCSVLCGQTRTRRRGPAAHVATLRGGPGKKGAKAGGSLWWVGMMDALLWVVVMRAKNLR